MSDYKQLIDQIKAFAPVYQKILKTGATPGEIADFQKQINVSVPGNFLSFYEIANGGESYEIVDIRGICFYSLERIPKTKKMFDEILAEKQAENEFFTWHTDWLPFADDYSYDTLVIDTTGKVSGKKGCILNRSKDSFEGDPITIISESFESFIQEWGQRVLHEKVYRKGSLTGESENWVDDYETEEYTNNHVKPNF
ncbi:SMI1/KNR4 family protein [Fluviicola sp.]|uniref:SMI1/KNR4 family protein n=1 Tax=Fluviicola sp. TaxID=1917219 RepID=UPI00261214B3|nr:SMI1/KNR4 family protein [Fluviicola sp.]